MLLLLCLLVGVTFAQDNTVDEETPTWSGFDLPNPVVRGLFLELFH